MRAVTRRQPTYEAERGLADCRRCVQTRTSVRLTTADVITTPTAATQTEALSAPAVLDSLATDSTAGVHYALISI